MSYQDPSNGSLDGGRDEYAGDSAKEYQTEHYAIPARFATSGQTISVANIDPALLDPLLNQTNDGNSQAQQNSYTTDSPLISETVRSRKRPSADPDLYEVQVDYDDTRPAKRPKHRRYGPNSPHHVYKRAFDEIIIEAWKDASLFETDLLASQIGTTIWQAHEKEQFFSNLARFSRYNLRKLTTKLPDKSEAEIKVYLDLLEDGHGEVRARRTEMRQKWLRHMTRWRASDTEAAVEVSEECAQMLDHFHGERLRIGTYWKDLEAQEEYFANHCLLNRHIAKDLESLVEVEEKRILRAEAERLSIDITDRQRQHEMVAESTLESNPAGASDISGIERPKSEQLFEAVKLLRLEQMIELSTNVFMNRGYPAADENWRMLCKSDEERTDGPAMFATAFIEFYTIVINLTRQLVSSAHLQALSRLRACDKGDIMMHPPFIRKGDVYTAADLLKLPRHHTRFKDWIKKPREYCLEVHNMFPKGIDRVATFFRWTSLPMPLSYTEVERVLRRPYPAFDTKSWPMNREKIRQHFLGRGIELPTRWYYKRVSQLNIQDLYKLAPTQMSTLSGQASSSTPMEGAEADVSSIGSGDDVASGLSGEGNNREHYEVIDKNELEELDAIDKLDNRLDAWDMRRSRIEEAWLWGLAHKAKAPPAHLQETMADDLAAGDDLGDPGEADTGVRNNNHKGHTGRLMDREIARCIFKYYEPSPGLRTLFDKPLPGGFRDEWERYGGLIPDSAFHDPDRQELVDEEDGADEEDDAEEERGDDEEDVDDEEGALDSELDAMDIDNNDDHSDNEEEGEGEGEDEDHNAALEAIAVADVDMDVRSDDSDSEDSEDSSGSSDAEDRVLDETEGEGEGEDEDESVDDGAINLPSARLGARGAAAEDPDLYPDLDLGPDEDSFGDEDGDENGVMG